MQLTTEQWNAINVILSHYNVKVSCDDEVAKVVEKLLLDSKIVINQDQN